MEPAGQLGKLPQPVTVSVNTEHTGPVGPVDPEFTVIQVTEPSGLIPLIACPAAQEEAIRPCRVVTQLLPNASQYRLERVSVKAATMLPAMFMSATILLLEVSPPCLCWVDAPTLIGIGALLLGGLAGAGVQTWADMKL